MPQYTDKKKVLTVVTLVTVVTITPEATKTENTVIN